MPRQKKSEQVKKLKASKPNLPRPEMKVPSDNTKVDLSSVNNGFSTSSDDVLLTRTQLIEIDDKLKAVQAKADKPDGLVAEPKVKRSTKVAVAAAAAAGIAGVAGAIVASNVDEGSDKQDKQLQQEAAGVIAQQNLLDLPTAASPSASTSLPGTITQAFLDNPLSFLDPNVLDFYSSSPGAQGLPQLSDGSVDFDALLQGSTGISGITGREEFVIVALPITNPTQVIEGLPNGVNLQTAKFYAYLNRDLTTIRFFVHGETADGGNFTKEVNLVTSPSEMITQISHQWSRIIAEKFYGQITSNVYSSPVISVLATKLPIESFNSNQKSDAELWQILVKALPPIFATFYDEGHFVFQDEGHNTIVNTDHHITIGMWVYPNRNFIIRDAKYLHFDLDLSEADPRVALQKTLDALTFPQTLTVVDTGDAPTPLTIFDDPTSMLGATGIPADVTVTLGKYTLDADGKSGHVVVTLAKTSDPTISVTKTINFTFSETRADAMRNRLDALTQSIAVAPAFVAAPVSHLAANQNNRYYYTSANAAALPHVGGDIDFGLVLQNPANYNPDPHGTEFGLFAIAITDPAQIITGLPNGVNVKDATLYVYVSHDLSTIRFFVQGETRVGTDDSKLGHFVQEVHFAGTPLEVLKHLPFYSSATNVIPGLWFLDWLENVDVKPTYVATQWRDELLDTAAFNAMPHDEDSWAIILSILPTDIAEYLTSSVGSANYVNNNFKLVDGTNHQVSGDQAHLEVWLYLDVPNERKIYGERHFYIDLSQVDPRIPVRKTLATNIPAKIILPTDFVGATEHAQFFDGQVHTITDDKDLLAPFIGGDTAWTKLVDNGISVTATFQTDNKNHLQVTFTFTKIAHGTTQEVPLRETRSLDEALPATANSYTRFAEISALDAQIYDSIDPTHPAVSDTTMRALYSLFQTDPTLPATAQKIAQLLQDHTSYDYDLASHSDVTVSFAAPTFDFTADTMTVAATYHIGGADQDHATKTVNFVLHLSDILARVLVTDTDVTVVNADQRYVPVVMPTVAELLGDSANNKDPMVQFGTNLQALYTLNRVVNWTLTGTDKAATKVVTADFVFQLKSDPTVEHTLHVTLTFGHNLSEYVQAELDRQFSATASGYAVRTKTFSAGTNGQDNFQPTVASFGAWWTSVTLDHPAIFDQPAQTEGHVKFSVSQVTTFTDADNRQYGATDVATQRGFMVTVTAVAVDSQGTIIPGTTLTKVVPVVVVLDPNSAEAIAHRVTTNPITIKDEVTGFDYSAITYDSNGHYEMPQNLWATYITWDNQPFEVAIKSVVFVKPTTAAGTSAQLIITYEYALAVDAANGETKATYVVTIDKTMDSSMQKLQLENFVTATMKIPQTGVSLSAATYAPKNLAEFGADSTAQTTAILTYLKTYGHDLAGALATYNAGKPAAEQIHASFAYTYDPTDPVSRTATFGVTLTMGSTTHVYNVAVNFDESFLGHLKSTILATLTFPKTLTIVDTGDTPTPLTIFDDPTSMLRVTGAAADVTVTLGAYTLDADGKTGHVQATIVKTSEPAISFTQTIDFVFSETRVDAMRNRLDALTQSVAVAPTFLATPVAHLATNQQNYYYYTDAAALPQAGGDIDFSLLLQNPTNYNSNPKGTEFGLFAIAITDPAQIITGLPNGVNVKDATLYVYLSHDFSTIRFFVQGATRVGTDDSKLGHFVQEVHFAGTPLAVLKQLPFYSSATNVIPGLWFLDYMANVAAKPTFVASQWRDELLDMAALNAMTDNAARLKILLSILPTDLAEYLTGSFEALSDHTSFKLVDSKDHQAIGDQSCLEVTINLQVPNEHHFTGWRTFYIDLSQVDPRVPVRKTLVANIPAQISLPATFVAIPEHTYLFDGQAHIAIDDKDLLAPLIGGDAAWAKLVNNGISVTASFQTDANNHLQVVLTFTKVVQVNGQEVPVSETRELDALLSGTAASYARFAEIAALDDQLYDSIDPAHPVVSAETVRALYSLFQADPTLPATAQKIAQLLQDHTSYDYDLASHPGVTVSFAAQKFDLAVATMTVAVTYHISGADQEHATKTVNFVLHLEDILGRVLVTDTDVTVVNAEQRYVPVVMPTVAELIGDPANNKDPMVQFGTNLGNYYTLNRVANWALSGTDQTATKVATADFIFQRKDDPTIERTLHVTLTFGHSLDEYVREELDRQFPNAADAPYGARTNAFGVNANGQDYFQATVDSFGTWWTSITSGHPAIFAQPVQTEGHVKFTVTKVTAFTEVDNGKYGVTDTVTQRGFKVTITAFAVDSQGTEIPDTTFTKEVLVVVNLDANSAEAIAHKVTTNPITIKSEITGFDYSTKTYDTAGQFEIPQNLWSTYITWPNQPLDVVIKSVVFVKPPTADSTVAHFIITYEYALDVDTANGETKSTYVVTIEKNMDSSLQKLQLDNFAATTMKIPQSGVSLSAATYAPKDLAEFGADSTAQTAAILTYLKTYGHDLAGALANYNNGKPAAEQIQASFTYTYDPTNPVSRSATFGVTLTVGSATHTYNVDVAFDESFLDHVKDAIFNSYTFAPATTFTTIADSGDAITPPARFTSVPNADQLVVKVSLPDGTVVEKTLTEILRDDDITITVMAGSLTYNDPNATAASFKVRLEYGTGNGKVTAEKTVSFVFSESQNQYLTNLLPTDNVFGDATDHFIDTYHEWTPGFNPSEIVNWLKTGILAGTAFASDDVQISSVTRKVEVRNTPLDGVNYRLVEVFEFDAKIGDNSQVRHITFTGTLRTGSLVWMDAVLHGKTWPGHDLVFQTNLPTLRTAFGQDYAKLGTTQTFTTYDDLTKYMKYMIGANERRDVEDSLLKVHGIVFAGATITPPADDDAKSAKITIRFTNTHLAGVTWEQTFDFEFEHSVNELKALAVATHTVTITKASTGLEVKNNVVQDRTTGTAFDLQNYVNIPTGYTVSDLLINPNLEEGTGTNAGKLYQVITLKLTYGAATPIEYTLKLELSQDASLYVDYVLAHEVTLSATAVVQALTSFTTATLTDATHDATIFVGVHKTDTAQTAVLLTDYFATNLIKEVRVSRVPTNDEKAGQLTVVFVTADAGEISKVIDFEFTKSPNTVALETLINPTSHQLASQVAWTQDASGKVEVHAQSQAGKAAASIMVVAPFPADLGVTDTSFDADRFVAWMTTNTDFDFNLATPIAGADFQFNPITITAIDYDRNVMTADQTLTVHFQSGAATTTLAFHLYFDKSQHAKDREDGIQGWDADNLFVDSYQLSADFHQPRVGTLGDPTSTDFKLAELVNNGYEVVAVTSYTAPTGDGTQASLTVTIRDNDPGAATHDPQTLTFTFDFAKSPNQVKTDALGTVATTAAPSDVFTDAQGTKHPLLHYTFQTFTTAPDQTPTAVVWPNGDAPTVDQVERVTGTDSIHEEFKLTVHFGNAKTPAVIYVLGEIDHTIKAYLDLVTTGVQVSLPADFLQSESSHPTGVLPATQLADSHLVVGTGSPIAATNGRLVLTTVQDVIVTQIEIRTVPTGDATQGTMRVTFARYANNQADTSVTTTVDMNFDFTHSANDIAIHNFLAQITTPDLYDVSATTGATTPIPQAASTMLIDPQTAPTDAAALLTSQVTWLRAHTNLGTLETAWGIPSSTTIASLTFTQNPKTADQTVVVTYQLGKTVSVAQSFTLHFALTPNQFYLNGLAATDVFGLTSAYLDADRTTAPLIPTVADLQLKAGFTLDGASPIHDFAPPSDDEVAASVQITVHKTDDPSAVQTYTLSFNFKKAVNQVRMEQVSAVVGVQFYIDPYVNSAPTESEVRVISKLFGASTSITDITKVANAPDDTTNNIKERYTAVVHFGKFEVTVNLLRLDNPLKLLLDAALNDFHYDVLPAVKAAQPSAYSATAQPGFDLYDDQNAPHAPDSHIGTITTTVYTPPSSGDHTQATLAFDVVYTDQVYEWINDVDGSTLHGTNDFLATHPGYHKASTPSVTRSFTEHRTITFDFAHSQNYYDLEDFAATFTTDYGAPATTGSATKITQPVSPPSSLVGGDTAAQVADLKRLSNFVDTALTTAGITISGVTYSHTADNADATVTLTLQKGTSTKTVTLTLHFSKTNNQDALDNMVVADLVTATSPNYLAAATRTAPVVSDFTIASDYEVAANGVGTYSGLDDDDDKTATIQLTIWRKDDHTATRTVEISLTFSNSINEQKLARIAHHYAVDPFWQPDVTPIPTGAPAGDFLLGKLATTDSANFDSTNLFSTDTDTVPVLSNVRVVTDLSLLQDAAFVRGWSATVTIGNASKTVYFGQINNPLQSKFDAVMQDLQIGVQDSIGGDVLTHSIPVEADLVYTKNAQPFALPSDSNSADGAFVVVIESVDLPQNADDHTATIHYTATFTLTVNGVNHDYVKTLTAQFDYQYSNNEIAIQTVLRAVGTTDTASGVHTIAGPGVATTMDVEAPETFASVSALTSYIQAHSDTALGNLLNQNGVQISSFTYGAGGANAAGHRDVKSADQNLALTFTKGRGTFTINVVLKFSKSHNQKVLDDLVQADLFGKPVASYIHVTKVIPPTAGDLPLKLADYEVATIGQYTPPSADPNDGDQGRQATVVVTVRRVDDPNASRTMTINLEFETFGIDVGAVAAATTTYTSAGQTIANLPGGTTYAFKATDPAINGHATINAVVLQQVSQGVTTDLPDVPVHTKLEYKVVARTGGVETTLHDWGTTLPTGLQNGQILLVRLVSVDPAKFTIENAHEIELQPVAQLVIPVVLPANFQLLEPTYSGIEGGGELADAAIPNFYLDYGLATQTQTNAHVGLIYTITHKDTAPDPAPVHTNAVASAIHDLRVGMYVYANVYAEDGYFIVNAPASPGQKVGQVTGLKIAPSISTDQVVVNTNNADGSRGHHGKATLVLEPKDPTKLGSAYPDPADYWVWTYRVERAGKIVHDWSLTVPTDLQNGDKLHLNYAAKSGYVLDTTREDGIFEISGLIYEVTLPQDIKPVLPLFVGYEGSGTFAEPTSGWFTASRFDYSDYVTMEFKVLDAAGNLKQDYVTNTAIVNLNVGDQIYGRYIPKNGDYLIMNPQTDVFVGRVTNLQITPRIEPIDLHYAVTGVRGRAIVTLQDEHDNAAIVVPISGQDHWHWEFRVTTVDAAGTVTIRHDWTSTEPNDLDNGQVVHVRVVADTDYVLDATYDELSFVIANLKTEINVDGLGQPRLDFTGYLGEGRVQGMTTDGVQAYQIPDQTHWEYYVAPIGESPATSATKMLDETAWTRWDTTATKLGPEHLDVNMGIYLRLKVDDPAHYVLSHEILSNVITVTRLAIDTSQVRAHFSFALFDGEGALDIDYRDPDVEYTTANPFVANDHERNTRWEMSVNGGAWQAINLVKDLHNDDQVEVRSVPINSDYVILPGEEIDQNFKVAGLFIKIDTESLFIVNWKEFADIASPDVVVPGENLPQIVSGEAMLHPARIQNDLGTVQTDDLLPSHAHLYYKFIPFDSPQRSFDDVEATLTPPPPANFHRGLSNGDKIMIYLGSDDPAYRVSDSREIEFVVSKLSPLPPTNLHPIFLYNNEHENQGISGQGYGATLPSSENIENFKWVYLVLRYDAKLGPYVPEHLPDLPNNPAWTDEPPTHLRNGDVVFYRLATELVGGKIKEGTFEDKVTHEQVRLDYRSDPILIEGLIQVVHVDTAALQGIEFTFEGTDGEGYVKEAPDPLSALNRFRASLPAEAHLDILVNGVRFDAVAPVLRNGDQVEVRVVSEHGVAFDVEDAQTLNKTFIVTGLQPDVNKKQQTVKIVLSVLAGLTGIGLAGIFLSKYMHNRKGKTKQI